MKKILFFLLTLVALNVQAQRLPIVNGWKYTAPTGTYQNLFRFSQKLDNAAWDKGGNISCTATDVANDHEGNATMDELTISFTSSNTLGQTLTVTPCDSIYIEFDAALPASGAIGAATYQFYDLTHNVEITNTSYYGSLSTTVTRLRFGILVPSGCTSLICRPFGDVSSTGKIIIGDCQIKKIWNYLYIETTNTTYP